MSSSEAESNNSEQSGKVNAEEKAKGDFSLFSISKSTKKTLIANNITYLFEVQSSTFNKIYEGKDIVVKARTGTGKTFSFLLPVIERMLKKSKTESKPEGLTVLVLAPTRELAKQICDNVPKITSKVTATCVYGGSNIHKQLAALGKNPEILVGTPGRMKDLIENHGMQLNTVEYVILDECDRMLDMGFLPDVEEILSHAYTDGKPKPQTLIFSATVPDWVKKSAVKYLVKGHETVNLIGDDEVQTSCSVEHLAMECEFRERPGVVANVLRVYSGSHGRAIVFCETKKEADMLSTSPEMNLDCHVLHGDIPQDKREMVMAGFRDGKYKVLVTTDVAARGLDIPDVELVVITGPPLDSADYIHRSGRTGRANRKGVCCILYKPKQRNDLKRIESDTGVEFKRTAAPVGSQLLSASVMDAAKSIKGVAEDVSDKFKDAAQQLIDELTPVKALSSALAVISGCTKMKQGSLMSGKEGYTAYKLVIGGFALESCGLVFSLLKKCLYVEDLRGVVGKIMVAEDKQSAFFDLNSEWDDTLQQNWKDSDKLQLFLAESIDEGLQTTDEAFPRREDNGYSGGRGGSRGGFGGRGGRGGSWQNNGRESRGGFGGGRGRGGDSRGGRGGFRGGFRGGRGGAGDNSYDNGAGKRRFNDSQNGGNFSSGKVTKFDSDGE